MVPANQLITVNKTGRGLDEWGRQKPGGEVTLKCRLDYSTKLVKDRDGKEVVSTASILMNGLVEIGYSDVIKWVDESGNEFSRTPLSISILRDLGGKPLATAVRI